jgi:hypothetical protein
MNDKYKLEKSLFEAGNESAKFFSKFPYEKMNEAVFLKIASDRKTHAYKKHFNFSLIAKISVLSTCCIILLTVLFSFKTGVNFRDNKKLSMGKPASQQLIKFDNSDLHHWLYFFNINKPDKIDDNLLAVIWNSGTSGSYEMAYSSLLENSNKPCPVAMISFPDDLPSMLIISSQNEEKKYIHYRIIGCKENKIMAYMEQNFVTGGKIEVMDGVLKETRLVPNSYVEEDYDMRQMVTYYIPYQFNEFGDIILAVENLKINRGEYIAIIGDISTPIESLKSDLLLDWDVGHKLLNIDRNIKLFHAKNLGREELYIKPINGGTPNKISLEVVDVMINNRKNNEGYLEQK